MLGRGARGRTAPRRARAPGIPTREALPLFPAVPPRLALAVSQVLGPLARLAAGECQPACRASLLPLEHPLVWNRLVESPVLTRDGELVGRLEDLVLSPSAGRPVRAVLGVCGSEARERFRRAVDFADLELVAESPATGAPGVLIHVDTATLRAAPELELDDRFVEHGLIHGSTPGARGPAFLLLSTLYGRKLEATDGLWGSVQGVVLLASGRECLLVAGQAGVSYPMPWSAVDVRLDRLTRRLRISIDRPLGDLVAAPCFSAGRGETLALESAGFTRALYPFYGLVAPELARASAAN